MNNNVIVCFNNNEYYCKKIISHLIECGMNVELSSDSENMIMKNLSTRKYNAIVIFSSYDSAEKINLISRIRSSFPEISIAIFVYMSLYKYCREFVSAGANRCIIMPQNVRNACNCIIHMMNDQHLYLQETVNFMVKCGFVPKVNGFYYFCSAIEICTQDSPNSVSEIYMAVAERFGTTIEIIESSIRHFIKVAYNKGVIDKFLIDTTKRPSNHEMINLAVKAMSDFYEIFDGKVIEKNDFERLRMSLLSLQSVFQ